MTAKRRTIIIGTIVGLLLIGGGVFTFAQLQNNDDVIEEQPTKVTCEPSLECGEWSACVDVEQVRTCTDTNTCEGSESRKESRECEIAVEEPVDETPVPDTPPAQESGYIPPTLGPFDIEIRGDASCQQDISTALEILRTRTPEYYDEVEKYVGVIECNPFEGDFSSRAIPFENPPRIVVGTRSSFASFEAVASLVVHEMIHNRDYLEYLVQNKPSDNQVPQCVGQGLEAEIETYQEQIQVMKKINTPQREIQAVEEYLSSGRVNNDYAPIPCE